MSARRLWKTFLKGIMGNPEEVDFNFDDEAEGLRALPAMRATKLTKEASAASIRQNLEDKISGKIRNIPFPNMPMMDAALAMLPGSIMALCGSSKTAKSFLILQWLWQWMMVEVEAVLLVLESGCEYHGDRMFTQMAANADFFNPEKLRTDTEIAAAALAAEEAWRPWIEYIAPNIHDLSSNRKTVGNVLAWIEREFRGQGISQRKAKIVIVDPVTAIAPDPGQRFADHQRLIEGTNDLVKQYQGRVIFVTHPTKTQRGYRDEEPHLDRLANGQCYPQFCSAIGWLGAYSRKSAKCDECKGKGSWKTDGGKAHCKVCAGTGKSQKETKANREFHWLAVRNAAKPQSVPMFFNGGTLTYNEVLPNEDPFA